MWNRAETEINMTLIRHGATKANLEHRYLGKTEEALSEEGKEKLQMRKDNGMYATPNHLFVSPMFRCRETAAILFPNLPFQCIPEWTEMDFGLFEGKNYKDLNGNPEYQAWIDSGGMLPFPKGESREAFQKRVVFGFFRMLSCLEKEKASEKDKITAVVHGGTIMALLSALSGGEYFDYQVKCADGYRCQLRCSGKIISILELEKLC